MADVRGASGVPGVNQFITNNSPTPSTPIYVDTSNGDLYALISNAVKRIAGSSVSGGLTATGTTQGTAYSMTSTLNVFTTVAANTGAILTNGPYQIVFNGGANSLKVYPPTGAKINNLTTNTFIFLATNTACVFWYVSSTQWVGVLSA